MTIFDGSTEWIMDEDIRDYLRMLLPAERPQLDYHSKSYYGRFGAKRGAPFWLGVRIKRKRDSRNFGGGRFYQPGNPGAQPVKVQKKAPGPYGRDRWISLGTFDTEDEALAILEDEVAIMIKVEEAREQLTINNEQLTTNNEQSTIKTCGEKEENQS